jgi:hypothetical protein
MIRRISRIITDPARDPHAPDVYWRYDAKWGLECSGSVIRESGALWSWGGAEQFVPTPERVALWYRLMREATPGHPAHATAP